MILTPLVRGFAKLKKPPKIQKKLDSAHPTIQTFFFGNPSLTWTKNSNYDNQQLLAIYIQTEYMVQLYTTPKHQYWFRAILGRFCTHKIPCETWTHPPTSIVISDFFLCKPLNHTNSVSAEAFCHPTILFVHIFIPV